MTLALYGKSKRRQGSLLLLGVFAVFVALLAGLTLRQDSANALTLGSANGTWTAITGGPDCQTGLNTNEVRWGDPSFSSGCGSTSDRSGYRWDGGSAATFSAGQSFLLGKFTHYNNPVYGNAATSVTLSLPLAFTDPVQNVNLSVVFNHDETPNYASPCAYPAADNSNGCADRVQLPSLADQVFQVGENLYKLEFTGFRPLSGTTTCPASDPGGTEVNTFYTKENATNRACIYAKLTFTAPVVDVVKEAVSPTVNQGQDAAFKITVKNSSSPAATGWNLSDQLPAGFSWTIDPAVAGCSISVSQLLTCTNLTIPAGDPNTPGKVEIIVKASTVGAACEPITNLLVTVSKTGKPDDTGGPATVNVTNCPVAGTLIVYKVANNLPSGNGPYAGTVSPAINSASTWSITEQGGNQTFTPTPNGTYTVNETGMPKAVTGGKIELVGYKVTTSIADCSTSEGDYSLSANQATIANDTKVVCVLNKFVAIVDPTISKEKASEGVTGGYAYWDVKVNNSANPNDAVGVFVKDDATLVSVSGGSCAASAGASLASGTSCTVTAGATLVVKVKKEAPTAQCLPQYINNSASVWRGTSDSGDPISPSPVGNTEATKYTIAGNASKCGQPSITKKLVNGGTEPVTVTDPNDIAWTVVVTNPATLPGAAQTVVIRDSNVIVTSGPSFTNGADCTPNNATGDFQTALTGSGVSCTMPGGASVQSTITFTVKPSGTVARECQDKPFNNTASIQIGDADPINAVGPTITLQGDAAKCTRNLEICKVVVGNGDLAVRSGAFDFGVREDGATTINGIGGLNASEPNPDNNPGANGTKVCKTVKVATDKTISVFEFGSRPANWGSDASGYPKYSINGGAQVSNNTTTNVTAGTPDLNITFYNRPALPTKNVTFQKYICNSLGDVAKNEGSGGVDQVGMPSISATGGLSGQLNQTAGPVGGGTAVTPSNDGRNQANCHLWGSDQTKYPEETGDWDMQIWNNSRGSLLQTVNIPAGGTISVPLTDAVLLETLKAGSDGARVEEELRTGYGFGSLKCYTDHKNQDNWEWLDFNPGGIPTGEVYCIAYNVPADKQITIEKRFVELNGTVPTVADVPGFTLDPSANTSCAAPVQQNATTWTVTCTVPYDWNGTVAETLPLPAGWQQTQCTAETQTTEQNLRFTFCNRPVGTVVVVKYENVPPATTQTWTFNGTVPGAPVALQTTGTTNATGTASTTLTNVPAGSYTLAELQGRGQCESGTTSSDYQTRGLTSSSLPSATDVNGAPIIGANDLTVTVQKGTTTYVAFGNQGCGSVLSGQQLQVFKYSDPAGNFTGTTELAGWTISITGTAGAATGFNASEDTALGTGAFFLGIPDGTYTVCETAKTGWAVVGSKYNATNQAGVCRTGVVVALDQTVVVNFYNQPRVNIEVNKTEISLATPSGAPGNGWNFTLSGCGVGPLSQATAANGKATFTDLPPAVGCSYTVTETVKSGWSAINPVQVTAPATAGQTSVLNFTNVKIAVFTDCTPTTTTPTPTPETPTPEKPTPTATATPEKPTDPTATPTEEPTEKPTEDIVSGEKTPGPGQTPLAPSAGNGLMGGGAGGVNMLMALVGLLALSLGSTILAIGRKSSRR